MKKTLLSLFAILLLLTACGQTTDSTVAIKNSNEDKDWPNFSGEGSQQQYSDLDQVNLATIERLRLSWSYDLEPSFTASSPVKGGDKLFITTGVNHIRAFSAKDGELIWEYDAKTLDIAPSALNMTWGNKGLAWWNNRVFIATTDGRVIALDDQTGKELWTARQFELGELRNSNGAPRVFDGKVIIGHGGADMSPIRGYVSAFDGMTGQLLWRFYTVPGDPTATEQSVAEKLMQSTWLGDWYGKGGGGTAWHAFSYDRELNLIYLGVGNGFPYNQHMRSPGGGDNLFLSSIVAVNADSGEYVWHYQTCPAEQWDCTATMDMTIATIDFAGIPRKVLMQAPKNGFFYVLDAATGELISAEKIDKVSWAERIDLATGRPVENPGIRYQNQPGLFELWPGPQGAHSWLPQAYSEQTGLIYVPIMRIGALIGPPRPGAKDFTAVMGVTLLSDADLPDSRRSFLKAWDPVKQQQAWQVELPGDWPGGILATAGGLVFQGRLDGYLKAYDALTGTEVWSHKTAAPVVAPPISYSVDGKQYISVLTGNGSQGAGILATGNANIRTDYRLQRRLLTFALDGTANLPETNLPARIPAIDPDFVPDEQKVVAGAMAFAHNACIVCHGINAVGGGAAPDLRYSSIILNELAFKTIVKDGALVSKAMPANPHIDDEQLELIRYYLRAVALGVAQQANAIQ
jgi:quinohemoprotein ethanol dehydrogenase